MRRFHQLAAAAAFATLTQLNPAQAAAPTYTFDQATACGTWCYHDPSNTKLTDGIVGNRGWALNAGTEWVGWRNISEVNITFQFAGPMNFSSVSVGTTQDNLSDVVVPSFTLWAYLGGSWTQQAVITNPASNANDSSSGDAGPHLVFTFSGLNVTTDQLRLTASANGPWTFVDEVSFNAAPVPEPETWAMLLAGLGLVGLARRKRAG